MSNLNSPMSSRPWSEPGTGPGQAGERDGLSALMERGAPSASTAGGPVGMQITENLGTMPASATMPQGTAIKV